MNRLPVLEKTYELVLWLVPTVAEFPRHQRYLLGERLESSALDLLDLLVEAQMSPVARNDALQRAGVRVDRMMYLLRLSHDLKVLSSRRYEHGVRLLHAVGQQVGGWLRSNRPAPAAAEK